MEVMNSSPSSKNLLTAIFLALPLAACGSSTDSSTAPPLTTADAGVGTAPDAAPDAGVGTAPDLAGRWKSACTPMSASQWFVLDFDISRSTWAVDYAVFADSGCATKFLTVRIEGPYELGVASSTVPGAFDAKFGFTKKAITPHLPAAADFLASAGGCGAAGFTAGEAKDIGTTGCAGLGQRPISACSADYDIARLDGDVLTFGERPADNDMCSEGKRPKALAAVSSKRQ
jgi:hypothetical protein